MRFSERTSLSDFTHHRLLVACPRCREMASLGHVQVSRRSAGQRLVCSACGHTAEWLRDPTWQSPPQISAGPRLDHFDLDLWLQTPCAGRTLWAYNGAHLAFLEEYIAAPLRESLDDREGWEPRGGPGRRLPRWMLLAKHRSGVLRGFASLRERLLGDA